MASFSLDISKFVEKVNGRADTVVRKIALDLLRRIILRTPVGNPDLWKHPAPAGYVGGRARANWSVAIEEAANIVFADVDKSGNKALNRALKGALAPNEKLLGKRVFITNHLPYIIRLENGWSGQAPSGMVKITVREYQELVKKAVAEAKRERK